MTNKRIGLFGGTFDPIHHAHLAVGMAAQHQLKLDRVLFMVANVPWQKAQSRHISSAADRLAMTAAGVAGRTGLEASDLEITRGGDSYTADTVEQLHVLYPRSSIVLIIGSDLVDDLKTWKRWHELPGRCSLAIAYRPGEETRGELAPGWLSEEIRLPALELSSTELREMSAQGRPLDFLVPDAVIELIVERGLYRTG